MRKAIGILLLSSWIPFTLGMLFVDAQGNSNWYTISAVMLFIFGTWAGVLLLIEKK